jgi:hypothetical protein
MGEQNLDDSEDIEVVYLPIREALEMAATGEFKDAKTVAGLFHLQAWLENRGRLQSKAQ